jgi:subtilase family serine protease
MLSTDQLLEIVTPLSDPTALPGLILPNSVQALVDQPVDLVGKEFDVIPGTFPNNARAGDTVAVNYRLQNSGDLPVGSFKVSFYLSIDNVISRQDFLLGTDTIIGGPPATIGVLNTFNLTLPGINNSFWSGAGDGNYFIGMIIDPDNQIPESNENNNSSVGREIDYDVITISNTRGANLRGKSFDAFPEPLNAGDRFNFNVEIENVGGAASGPFEVAFYLSTDRTITTSDRRITGTTISPIPANGSSGPFFLTVDQVLPGVNDPFWQGDGTYYIGMIVDSANAILETNEADNSNLGLGIDLDAVLIQNTRRANLKGKSFDVRPEPLNAGDRFNFDFEIENLGGATGGPFEVSFYLSTDRTITSSDRRITSVTINALAANGTTGPLVLTIDQVLPGIDDPFWQGDGTYYIGMIADSANAIQETNELDNSNLGLGIDLDAVLIQNTQRADLKGTKFDLIPEPLKAGDPFTVNYDIANVGGAAAGNFKVSFYLSKDNRIDTTDLLIGDRAITGLAGRTTNAYTQSFVLPGLNDVFWGGSGQYYVGMIIDSGNTVVESNEANNRNLGLLLDYDDVAITDTALVGTRNNDDLFGTAGNDFLYGLRGDDNLEGKAGNDFLSGDRGDDNLYGGLGDDFLDGGPGDDWLWGVDIDAAQPGAGEIDVLQGGFGADEFYLGSATKVFYTSPTLLDYAEIRDFDLREDTIVLNGSAGNYTLQQTSGSLPSGQGIYRNNELIGIVQGAPTLSLTASYFAYLR